MCKNLNTILLLLSLLIVIPSCKKKSDDPAPTPVPATPSPSANDYLTGNGSVKYWQAVAISQVSSFGGNNFYLTQQACAVDNYLTFFDNGDFEERNFGLKCYADERLINGSFKWNINGSKFKVNGMNGSSIYEISSTLFGSEVTITELTSTRFKGFRVRSSNDTIKFTLSAVPM